MTELFSTTVSIVYGPLATRTSLSSGVDVKLKEVSQALPIFSSSGCFCGLLESPFFWFSSTLSSSSSDIPAFLATTCAGIREFSSKAISQSAFCLPHVTVMVLPSSENVGISVEPRMSVEPAIEK